jgi:hypothetical protein
MRLGNSAYGCIIRLYKHLRQVHFHLILGVKKKKKQRLARFGIEHTTLQLECAACGQGANLSIAQI